MIKRQATPANQKSFRLPALNLVLRFTQVETSSFSEWWFDIRDMNGDYYVWKPVRFSTYEEAASRGFLQLKKISMTLIKNAQIELSKLESELT